MKNILSSIGLGVLLVGCGSVNTSNDLATNTPIATSIDLTRVTDDKIPVTIDPGRFLNDTITYYLPKVVQGTYAVSDFGRFVDDIKGFDYQGKEIPIKKLDANSWQIIGAKELDKVTYWVNDTYDIENIEEDIPFSPSGTNIEPQNYVLNLHGFIGYFDILKNNQYTLQVTSPSTMKKTSALQRVGFTVNKDSSVTTDDYVANRYFDITDNPMMYGDLDIEEFQVGDIKIVLSVYSPNKLHTAAQIKETVLKMMKAQKTYLGDINSTPRYDIYLYLAGSEDTAPTGFGALEHHTSTVVVLPEAIPDERLAEAMIDVVSHEFFHIVTPLSVHSEDVHYFDYNAPTFSKHLWMYEGITEYFATLFQVDQGLVSEQDFYAKIMDKIEQSKNYDDTMSFTVMSENILEPEYEKNYINVYQKGALIGMCIDLLLRSESDGTRGVLSLMKELSAKYGKSKPFEDDKIIDEIIAMTYPSIGEFLKKHVIGTTPIDYNEFFKKAGLGIQNEKIETSLMRNGASIIVGGDQGSGKIFFIQEVEDNSFWVANGVRPLDVITQVNGTDLSIQNANTILSTVDQLGEGDDIEMKLDREGKEIVIKTKVTKSFTEGKVLTDLEGMDETQKRIKEAWLKG